MFNPCILHYLILFQLIFLHFLTYNVGALPRFELPTNPQDLQTPKSLSIVLRNAQHLLSEYAIYSLPVSIIFGHSKEFFIQSCLLLICNNMQRIAERFEQDGSSTDPMVRGQIQEELVQVGLRMQQFGALLLDLGSSILTLHLEQSTVV